MAVRLRKALDTAKEYKACKPEVDEILKFWGNEFGKGCPYNPHDVIISPDQTKTLLVPEQQAQNYESRARLYDTQTLSHVGGQSAIQDRGSASHVDDSRSLFITRMPKKGVVLKNSPAIDEDEAVLRVRLALLAASHKADGDGEGEGSADGAPERDRTTLQPEAEQQDVINKRNAPERLKSLVRGTRTTLTQMQKRQRGPPATSAIAVTHMAAHTTGGPAEDSQPCPDLQELALFVAPDVNHDPEAARRPSTPHPARRSIRAGSSSGRSGSAAYVPRKKFSLKQAPPPFKYSKDAMLLRAKSKLKSRTLSNMPSVAESEGSAHLDSGHNSTVETFKVGDTVEARYRGRAAWLPGKITRCLVNGTYDILYLTFDEKGVSPSLIRHKTLDVRRVKAKLRISGMLATALRTDGADEEPPPVVNPSPERKRSIHLPEKPSKEKKTVVVEEAVKRQPSRHSSYVEMMEPEPEPAPAAPIDGKKAWKGALAKGLLATSIPSSSSASRNPASPDGRAGSASTLRRGNVSSAEDERKLLLEAIAEEERKKAEEKENNEKSRLWTELKRLVTKYQCEIKAKDLAVTTLLGRGKFAAVHTGRLRVHDVPHPSLDDPADHENIAPGAGGDPWHLEFDVGIKVSQFKNALPLPKELGEHKEHKPKKTSMDSYSDDEFEEDDDDDDDEKDDPLENLPPSRIILEYMREVRTLMILKHENIVGIHGVLMRPRLAVVLQLMDGKNLYQHLKDSLWQKKVGTLHRLEIILDVCKGLAHMHSQRYIHRDIKPHNVLLAYGAGGLTCKLSDFGTCIRVPASQQLSEQLGTSGYTAPEVFDPQAYSLPSDVFSLAILMWEVFYSHLHENPFTGLDPDNFLALSQGGVRPELDGNSGVSVKLNTLIQSCWNQDPENRPKMAEVLDMVNTIITEFYEQQEDTKDVEVASANAEFSGE